MSRSLKYNMSIQDMLGKEPYFEIDLMNPSRCGYRLRASDAIPTTPVRNEKKSRRRNDNCRVSKLVGM